MKTKFSKITVDEVRPHTYKQDFFTVQLRQEITKTYPGVKIGNSKSDNLFSEEDFSLPEGESYSSTRVAFLDFPRKDKNGKILTPTNVVQIVNKLLSENPSATLYKEIANEVELILTDEQIAALDNPKYNVTIEDYRNKFRVKDKDGKVLPTEIYQQIFFSLKGKTDSDFRTNTATSEVEEELNEALNV